VILLGVQLRLGDEHGEVAVLDAHLLDAPVEELGDRLPQAERPRAQDVAARDVVKLDHLTLVDHLMREAIISLLRIT
jgi:hypothetical protein